MAKGDALDPRGLIREAYAMPGIGATECRSIFLDWALAVPDGGDTRAMITALLERHGASGHPMTEVLRAGLDQSTAPRRRGGRSARLRDS